MAIGLSAYKSDAREDTFAVPSVITTYLDRSIGDKTPKTIFTSQSNTGLPSSSAATGPLAQADVDGDGDVDLYISNYGVARWEESAVDTGGEPNIMFANNGDGTFTDVTSLTNLGNPGHSTSGLFADYDHDGDLDVYSLNAGIYDEAVSYTHLTLPTSDLV